MEGEGVGQGQEQDEEQAGGLRGAIHVHKWNLIAQPFYTQVACSRTWEGCRGLGGGRTHNEWAGGAGGLKAASRVHPAYRWTVRAVH